MKLYEKLLVLIIFVNIVISLYVAIASGTDNYICDTGAGCDIVQNSSYSQIYGIKLAWFGTVAFSLLMASYFVLRNGHYWIFFLFTTAGLIFALYFMYLQIFVIKALCQNCMIIDIIAIIIFLVSAYDIHQRTLTKSSDN